MTGWYLSLRNDTIFWQVSILASNLLAGIAHGMVLPTPDFALTQVSVNRSSHALLTNEVPICVDNRDWIGQGIQDDDCVVVIDYMYGHYKDYFFNRYQFAMPESRAFGLESVVRTPIKLKYSKPLFAL